METFPKAKSTQYISSGIALEGGELLSVSKSCSVKQINALARVDYFVL